MMGIRATQIEPLDNRRSCATMVTGLYNMSWVLHVTSVAKTVLTGIGVRIVDRT